jgi:hypothetical protein
VHLANTLPKPISTPEELRAVKKEVQQMLTIFGLAEAPRRKELQSAHARNKYAEVADKAASLRVLLDEIEQEEPMEQWPRPKVEEFLEDMQPVRERIAKAEKLVLGKTS